MPRNMQTARLGYKNVIQLYETIGPLRLYIPVDNMKNVALRSIAFNYPGFQALPRGIKKMLVVSESFFFAEENNPHDVNLDHGFIGVEGTPVSPAVLMHPGCLEIVEQGPDTSAMGPRAYATAHWR